MPYITDEQAREAIRRGTDQINALRQRKMIAGKLDSSGNETLAGAPAGYSWVRSSPESREQTIAQGSASPAGAPIIVIEDYDGSLYIDRVDGVEAAAKLGDAAKIVTYPRGFDELLPKNIDALGFKPGRITASSSDVNSVAIEDFEYNGAIISLSDLDVSSYYPASADQYGRIGVYYNPSTAAAVGFAGTSGYDLTALLATDDRSSVPAGMVPLGAVIVSNDSAGDPNDITGANFFESWRGFVNKIAIPSIHLPASSGWASTTNGCATPTQNEYTTNDVDLYSMDFDQTSNEYAQWSVWMPDDWDGGTVTAKVAWGAASGSGDVIWGVQGRNYADDDAIDAAWGTAQEVTDTLTATGDLCITSATAAITLAGSPAAGQFVQFRVYRNAASGSDTIAADVQLFGVRISYTKV